MPSPKTHTFAPDSLMTSYQVGALLQVNPSSVNKWIEDGRIPAYRTPGGHRRIRADDLRAFLMQHNMPVPKGLLGRDHKVLAISDDPKVFDGLKSAPAGGIAFTFAQDGIDGLMQVGSLAPELIVLGPSIKPLDSFDVCRRLRASTLGQKAKVAMVVDPALPDGARRAKLAGASHVLSAPLSSDAIEALFAPSA